MTLTVIKHIAYRFPWGHKMSQQVHVFWKGKKKIQKSHALSWCYQSLSYTIFRLTGAPAFHIFKKPECTTKQNSIGIGQMFGRLVLPKNLHGLGLSNVKKSGRFFFKFCGLLTIYELYVTVLRPRVTRMKCIERLINLYSHDNAGASEQSHSMTLHTKNWEWVTPFSATDRRFPATF